MAIWKSALMWSSKPAERFRCSTPRSKPSNKKGRVTILSNIHLAEAVVMLRLIMPKEIEIVGSFQFNKEFEEVVRLIEAGSVDFDTLTADLFPLENTAHTLRMMADGKAFGKDRAVDTRRALISLQPGAVGGG